MLSEDSSLPARDRAGGLCAMGMLAWRAADYPESERMFTAALDQAEAVADRALLARAAVGLGDVLVNTGRGEEAIPLFEDAMRFFREERDLVGVARALGRIGEHHHLEGRFDVSSSFALESLAISRQLGDRVGVANSLFALGMNELGAGRCEAARKYLKESRALREELGDPFGAAWCLGGLGSASVQLGRLREARLELAEAVRGCLKNGDPWGLALICHHIVGLLARSHLPEEAFRLFGAALAARLSLSPVEVGWLDDLVAGWLDQARENLQPGSAEAAEAVGSGLPASELGAFAQECLALLDDHQDSVQSPISRRQTEVAQLVAQGPTNRDIAERLFISERTVDGHVQAILAKLEFRSRAQIAGWVAERE